MTTHRSLSIAGLALLGALACSDFATAPDRRPAALDLTPTNPLLTAGDTVMFALTVLDQDGEAYETLPSWAVPVWTIDETSLLEVSGAGVGRALGAGRARATAELAGLEAATVVRVNPQQLELSVQYAYVTQSAQRRVGSVPLVAGRDGLLRVYLRGDGPNFFQPTVRARFFRDGVQVHTETLMASFGGVPDSVTEESLALSFNAVIPGSVIQPGTGLVVEADVEGVVPVAPTSQLRRPAAGELALDVREVRPFRIRLVPVNHAAGESGLTAQTGPDQLRLTETLFPFAEFDVDVRAPYTTEADLSTADGWFDLIYEIAILRLDDGSPRYYFGGFRRPPGTNFLGLAWVGYPVAIGEERMPGTIAHEVGHNLDLLHAPCGNPAGVDPEFPYFNGSIGVYGYDRMNQRLHSPEDTYDVMSYCDPIWISDYHYERVLAYRDTSTYDAAFEDAATGGTVAVEREEVEVLIVHGGVRDGALRLGPALASRAPASLPRGGGRYTLAGLDADGAVLFSIDFEPRRLDHGEGAQFASAIPAALARPDRLATLRLSGPEGVVERTRGPEPAGTAPRVTLEDGSGLGQGARTVSWDAGRYPLVVVRDRATGQIVAMSRTGRLRLPGDPSGLDVRASDGVRTHRVDVVPR